VSAKSNPNTADARERQLAHEQAHNDRKYDKNGRRKADTLPPRHLKGARLLPRRNLFGHPL
jgi:hypothetical protein